VTTKSVAREQKPDPKKIVSILKKTYPNAQCALDFKSPLQLLIATILAAQCTDERVNQVTPELFKKYPSAGAFANADMEEIQQEIRSTGFFRQKAKSIVSTCSELEEKHGGKVPRDMDALVKLPGIGRKTANVVLGTAYGIPSGIVVDTHVKRLAYRMGLSDQKDPDKIEKDLMQVVPKPQWIDFAHRMTEHGRKVCVARKPLCEVCPLERVCPKLGVA
jgi:endonuclease-3